MTRYGHSNLTHPKILIGNMMVRQSKLFSLLMCSFLRFALAISQLKSFSFDSQNQVIYQANQVFKSHQVD